jgi:alkylated DNA repair dioxygenase AlkB
LLTHLPLTEDASVAHASDFLVAAEADEALAAVRDELAWEQREIVLFGRRVLQPRLIAWVGALPYRYSGQTLEPRPFTPTVAALLDRVSDATGVAFNHVLVNRYRDGRDSMGMHADDEPELGPDPVVATLSLGATRRFALRPCKSQPGRRLDLPLAHGSLLVMEGACQRLYRHGIPREPAVTDERISLTFRRIIPPVRPERPDPPPPAPGPRARTRPGSSPTGAGPTGRRRG